MNLALESLNVTLMHCYAFDWDIVLREHCQLNIITVYKKVVVTS